jgi:hypothetical protein
MRIVVIPDTQVKPGIDYTYLSFIGKYLVDKKPDIVVHLGDHWDMPSLSSYDIGKKTFEGRRYLDDIAAGNNAMDILLSPIKEHNERQRKNGKRQYLPRKVFLLGNHEQRIERAVNNDAKIEGVIGYKDLNLSDWEVHDFLDVSVISGIAFSHYFVTGLAGRPCSTAAVQLNKKHMSCISGHQQGCQIATGYRGDGVRLTSIIAGSCYEHNEDYLGHQGNKHWRGIIVLNDVTKDGEFDLMPISLKYLREKYEG